MAQYNRFIIISIFALLSGCSQSPKAPETSAALWEQNQELKTFYGEWYGTPYQFGGNTKEGIDCSAFVQQAFLHAYQRALPRTTLAQFNASQPIRWKKGNKAIYYSSKQRNPIITLGFILTTSSSCMRPLQKGSSFREPIIHIGRVNFGK